MRRRKYIALLGVSVVAWPFKAAAQSARIPVVGILNSQTRDTESERLSALHQGLKESGFAEGQNVALEYRFADGHNDRLPALAADLVQRQVAVLVANTTPPALAAKTATATIPIVFVTGVDPVEVGLVASLSRPGANVTGVTFLVQQLVAKRLELLSDLVPRTAPIGMLADQQNPNAESDVKNALAAAATLGRAVHVVKIAGPSDIDSAFAVLVQQRVSAVFLAPHANFRIWRQQVLGLAARHAMATSFSSSDFVTAGALMSYGPDQLASYREAGIYTGRILKGEKPAGLPVIQSTKFEFTINLKTAKALGVTIPPKMLLAATKLIE